MFQRCFEIKITLLILFLILKLLFTEKHKTCNIVIDFQFTKYIKKCHFNKKTSKRFKTDINFVYVFILN